MTSFLLTAALMVALVLLRKRFARVGHKVTLWAMWSPARIGMILGVAVIAIVAAFSVSTYVAINEVRRIERETRGNQEIAPRDDVAVRAVARDFTSTWLAPPSAENEQRWRDILLALSTGEVMQRVITETNPQQQPRAQVLSTTLTYMDASIATVDVVTDGAPLSFVLKPVGGEWRVSGISGVE